MFSFQQKEGLFLEIGVGANDFNAMPTPLVGVDRQATAFDFSGGNQYIGIDMPLQGNRYYRGLHQWFMPDGNLDIDEDAKEESPKICDDLRIVRDRVLPYRPNDSFNFLVADGHKLPLTDGSVSEIYMSNVIGSQMVDNSIEALLSEAKRVIGETGRLTIRENITPHWVPSNIEEMIAGAGFNSEARVYKYGTPEYAELVRAYGASWQDIEPDEVTIDDHKFMVVEQ